MPRLKPHEKRESLIKKRAELDAQLRTIEAQERETERKRDTRRKVIAGAIALEHIEQNATDPWAIQFRELLDRFVEARSRELFAFLPAIDAKATDSKVEKPTAGQAA